MVLNTIFYISNPKSYTSYIMSLSGRRWKHETLDDFVAFFEVKQGLIGWSFWINK